MTRTRWYTSILFSILAIAILAGCGATVANPTPAQRLPAGYQAPTPAQLRQNIAYGTLATQKLDLYVPAQQTRGLVVFYHGGGWSALDRTWTDLVVQRELTKGWAVASVEYRLAPANRFPAAVLDAKLAVRWLKVHASDYGVNASPIVAAGISAGGHLAAMVATSSGYLEPTVPSELTAVSSNVNAAIDLAGITNLATWGAPGVDMTTNFLGCAPAACGSALLAQASPVTYVSAASAPIFIVDGVNDKTVPWTQGFELAQAYAKTKGPYGYQFQTSTTGHLDTDWDVNLVALDAFMAAVR